MLAVMTRIDVALVHDGRVRVDPQGALPGLTLNDDGDVDGSAAALELVGAECLLAPVVRLADDRQLYVVGSRHTPTPGSRWVAVGDLPEVGVRGHLLRGAVEHATPPAGRPRWYVRGWLDEVEAWLDEIVTAHGQRRTGPLRTHRVWGLSAVLRVPTSAGELWFKACCDHFLREPAVVAALADLAPDLTPRVVARDEERGWLLMQPLRGATDATRADGAARALAARWSRVQLASLDLLDELRAAGCPDRGLEPTLTGWTALLADDDAWPGLTADELAALRERADEVERLVRGFWSTGLPDCLGHGDLHLGNVAYDGRELRVFDWTDACVTHPFLDGSHLAHFDERREVDEALVEEFAGPWRAAYPSADVDLALRLAPLVDRVFQAVTFAAIAAAGERSQVQFGGVMAWLARRILAFEAPGRPAG